MQLAHNRWDPVKGRSQVQVVHNFGRADTVDVAGMRRLAASITRFTDSGQAGPKPVDGADGAEAADGLRLISSRPMGAAWLLDGLWTRLGIADAIGTAVAGRRIDPGVERVLFALTVNRAIAPCSKLAALEWAASDVHLPGVPDLGADPQVFYRAMDLLVEHDEAIQEQVFFAVAGRLGLACDVLLFDTTSTYFETPEDDDFRRYGHSKDHRPDRPQAVIGLAVTKEGIPVRVWSWPGNSADSAVIKAVHADLAAWRLHRVLWVGDRGFTSAHNRELLQTGGGHVLFGEKLRGGADNAEALARPGRYRQIADNLHIKQVWVGHGTTRRRFIVVRNPAEATRDAATRTRHLERIRTDLAAIGRKQGDARLAAEGELLAHPVLKRYLTRTNGQLAINTAAVTAEEKLDGKFLLSCTDDNLPADDAARLFKGLLDVERAFRDLKRVLEVRPVYQRTELTDQQQAIYTHCQVTPPPLVHTVEPNPGAAQIHPLKPAAPQNPLHTNRFRGITYPATVELGQQVRQVSGSGGTAARGPRTSTTPARRLAGGAPYSERGATRTLCWHYGDIAPMNQTTTFSERLRLRLAERGMTQLELAAKVGVTRAAMSRYVSGEREPRFATLLRIAEVLEVHVDELLGSAAPTGQAALRLVARTTLSDAEKVRLREMIDGGEAP